MSRVDCRRARRNQPRISPPTEPEGGVSPHRCQRRQRSRIVTERSEGNPLWVDDPSETGAPIGEGFSWLSSSYQEKRRGSRLRDRIESPVVGSSGGTSFRE